MSANYKELGDKLRALFSRRGYTCDCCGLETFDYPKKRVCDDCENALNRRSARTCPACGRETVADGVCLTCKRKPPEFKRGLSVFSYEGAVSSMVNRFKNGERYLAEFFVERAAKLLLESEEFPPEFLIVCVPTTEEKLVERGFNQAEELARGLSRLTGLTFDNEVLIKRKETAEQKHLRYADRRKNLEGAFFVHKRKAIAGARILLVDDIMTTGSTGDACARVLKNAGAKEVIFLTVASTSERK